MKLIIVQIFYFGIQSRDTASLFRKEKVVKAEESSDSLRPKSASYHRFGLFKRFFL